MRTILACLPATALLLAGCDLTGGKSSSSDNSQNNSTTGQAAIQILATTDQAAADSSVQAIRNLPDKVGGRLDPATRASLESAHSTFQTDLRSNPSNTSASFGLAVTSLALKMDRFSDTLNRMWKNGLEVGSSNPDGMFQTTPTQVVQDQAFAGRALANTDSLPTIRGLQNTVELNFLPTVDSVVSLLQTCWNDPNFAYRFPVSGFSDRDSLTIGRGDVGLALAGVMAVRGYLVWLVAQDLEAGFPNQGFPNNYAWLDTLGNLDDSLGPQGTYQTLAFQNLQSLYAGTFYSVRSGYTARVAAIPGQIVSAADIAKSAADYAHQYQPNLRHGLVHIDSSDNAKFAQVMDSVHLYLSGPHTFVRGPHSQLEYPDSTCSYSYDTTIYTYTCSGSPKMVQYPGYSVRVDVSKLITMPDHKVFLPSFQWNAAADWAAKGPFSLKSGSTVTTYRWIKENKPSLLELDGKISWADPSFSGAFPTFKTSRDVLVKLDSLNEKPISSARVAGRLLPRASGF